MLLDFQAWEAKHSHCHEAYCDKCDAESLQWLWHVAILHLLADGSHQDDGESPTQTGNWSNSELKKLCKISAYDSYGVADDGGDWTNGGGSGTNGGGSGTPGGGGTGNQGAGGTSQGTGGTDSGNTDEGKTDGGGTGSDGTGDNGSVNL